ncbi:enoyl-CoA hydratase/isomerase family protein [Bacillus thermotolerans]|uniref:3-hydroxybutyryl-CoA dehydratase n=1 Tax=Bacillus thermotolerans TaxID=1221996 RepID=A0A0F5I557_BACTR|nr:enoyl-CoA hydratase-related protein [Bacillus thermotolerans]KKB40666.1 3-hydroxybutyryl-CoA dehydratase [Bacillus thermotolerans]KKB43799.1 3-hydroxybutyryl-CoA dehydratase [Bacillus thermotolerans]
MNTVDYIIENHIATVYLNRPPYNPLNTQLYQELSVLFEELEKNPEVRAVIITGKGDRAFAAGADINEMMNLSNVEMAEMSRVSREAYDKVEALSKPVIAAVNGLALGGGCELALACDFRICSSNTKFGLPEINLGIIPGGGGTQRLPRLVGQSKAKELLYFGEMIDAEKAKEIGLANKVTELEDLMSEAVRWAEKLAQKPVVAMSMVKKSINKGSDMGLPAALDLETVCFGNAFASEDRKEGMQSFVDKRKPQFTGR